MVWCSRLDLYTMHWELIHTRGVLPNSKPNALIGHSVQWVDPYLVVFAGGDGKKPSNELHTLELRTASWRQIDTSGAPVQTPRDSNPLVGSRPLTKPSWC